jgi:hypothetical protein
MNVWELISEGMGSPWLMTSATWGEDNFGRDPFELHPGICLTTEEKHGNLSRVAGEYSFRRLYRDSLNGPADHQPFSVTVCGLSAWSAQVSSKLQN